MSIESSGRMRRSSQPQPRNLVVKVNLSGAEKEALQSAAARRHLALAAYVAETALAAAEGRVVPVNDFEREVLRELMRVASALMDSHGRLKDAMARQETAGTDLSALEAAAAAIGQHATGAQDVLFRVAKLLPRRAR
jgi:uncharacterized protein (DUF1778 family)